MTFNPSVPPPAKVEIPDDEFEAWLVLQAKAGYDRMWLQRNRPSLRRRWETDPLSPLPPPPPKDPGKVPDRYGEP